ncbi:aldehyde ferredoxin oxidoreductase family protein [Thermanaerosceptrum fracticalcis]|uniref:aldehyde ferredoxin oxidoreductase family protein n=1 Tax=Thermanaerosceptrum fracticalcis TaxID=1712410 RepID=UPI000691A4A6|nr:aldehyde ferredoxin oxidoreductase family protein [Thermanaerosceptrum fracticalcis]
MVDVGAVQGKILRVNLTDGQITKETVPGEVYTKYLGGRGAGAYYLNKEVAPGTDPLGEDNKIIFFNGPMAGTMAPGNGKINVTFKSPLTNTYYYSLCGGHFGAELKFAGFDGIIIEGNASKPVYLFIHNDEAELKDAQALWGKTIPETNKILKEELGGDHSLKIACIGPGGEKLNRMACITAELYREFGRGGGGAVMGAKNLKAIVVRGTQDVNVASPGKLANYVKELYKEFKAHPKVYARRWYGSVEMLEGINKLGFWSTKNFSEGYFAPGEEMVGPKMREKIVVGDGSCYSCPIACGKISQVNSAKYGKILIEGPEFETVGLLGPNCGISDWETILKATQILDHNGIDTISAGAVLSFAMEAFEKGIITEKDTDGIDLRFGNGDGLIAMLEKMVKREGLGDLLAEGVKLASEKLGAPELAMHSKGAAPATYDPRGCKGMALTYATSSKGAHHMYSPTMGVELAGDRFAEKGKANLVRDIQMQMAVVDSLGYCSTMRFVYTVDKQVDLFNLATGLNYSKQELLEVGERILNLERLFNVREGFSRKDDTLPKRFLEEAMKEGPSQGQTIDLQSMLDEYYQAMGWSEDGIPREETIKRLGLY